MTSDEKHISKLAGDLKYDEKKHGSAAKMVSPLNDSKSTNKKHNTYNPTALKNHMKRQHANDEKRDIEPGEGMNNIQPQLTGMKKNK